MVKKLFALASVTALAGLIAAGGAACSSSDDNNATGNPDASTDAKSNKDASKPDSSEPPTDTGCYKEDEIGQLTDDTTAKFPGGKCTEEDIQQLLDLCFTGGSGGDAGADAGDCKSFQEAKADCFACVVGAKDTTDIPAFIITDSSAGRGLPALEACVAVASGKPECAVPLTNVTLCSYTACSSCDEDDKAAQSACFESAANGACSQIELSDDCKAVGNTENEDILAKCYVEKDGLETIKRTIDTLCRVGNK